MFSDNNLSNVRTLMNTLRNMYRVTTRINKFTPLVSTEVF